MVGLRTAAICLLSAILLTTAACSKTPAKGEPTAYSGQKVVQSMESILPPDYWPTAGWKTALPEEHGVDSASIAAMVEDFKDHNVHSYVLIRDGYVLSEGYSQAVDADTRQPLYSVTKSVTSAITGMLIGEHVLTGVDQKLKDFSLVLSEMRLKAI